jgi:lipopolysaccharide/colanic/teichoic acid biosynthesis glycosyltransferase
MASVQPGVRRRYDVLKRLMDVTVASAALAVSAPIQLVLAGLVRRRLGSPVLFRQRRPGKDEEIFELVKFRTMREPDPGRGLVTDADRITPFGAWLRSTSLDELPTFWNILKGDMSLVGPRPLLVRYLDRYSATERRRHEVRPGLTGLAQVHGRNTVDWPRRLALDVQYVDQRSLRLDIAILLATVSMVLRRRGVDIQGEEPEFLGAAAVDQPGPRSAAARVR